MSTPNDIKKEKRIRFNYGQTALKKARKSLETWKMNKDSELFLSLQHRISSEFIKFRTSNSFYRKDSRINENVQKVIEKRKLTRIIMESKSKEKFQKHYELYTIQNKMRDDKIRQYKRNYIQKGKKARLIKLKIKRKDLFLFKFNKEKDELCKLKKIVSDDIYKEKIYKIKYFLYEKNKLIEDKRKEIEKRNEEIEKFLYEKELINQQKLDIIDHYKNKYLSYQKKIDDILYKKNLDNNSLNKIKLITSFEPALE